MIWHGVLLSVRWKMAPHDVVRGHEGVLGLGGDSDDGLQLASELACLVLEARIATLMADDDVTKKRGIYVYVLNGQERNLNIRAFTDSQKREAYERQQGLCPVCGEHFELSEMEGDHITPWRDGGKTVAANCRMLCIDDNRRKGGV